LTEISQIGDANFHPLLVDPYPTRRDHPPFVLSIPKPLTDLYQLGNGDTRTSQQEAIFSIQQLLGPEQVTTDQINKAPKLVVKAIDGYHLLAQTIWPIAQPPISETSTKLHLPITKADTGQLKRITRLDNIAKRMLPNPKTSKVLTTDPQLTKQTQTQATEIHRLPDSPKLEDIPALCNKAIDAIINKANRKLTDSLRKKSNSIKRALSATTITSKPLQAYS
jgi:hypothetical protein